MELRSFDDVAHIDFQVAGCDEKWIRLVSAEGGMRPQLAFKTPEVRLSK